MSGTFEFPTGADGQVTPHLRALYAAPVREAYWEALEGRILGGIGVPAPAWWQVLGGWTRMGLVAAGIAAAVAGMALVESHVTGTRAAYRMVVEQPPVLEAPVASSVFGPAAAARDSSLRDLLEY